MEPWVVDEQRIQDLIEFARIEVESNDIEPWAAMIRALKDQGTLDYEQSLWMLKLYNAYDSINSAWEVLQRWPDPMTWLTAEDRVEAATYACTQERRNLRGGRVLQHLSDYAQRISGPQEPWLRRGLAGDDRHGNFKTMMLHVRKIWGVGRQTAFEWVEFLGKVADFPVEAVDAELWESEGPRRSIQKLYGNSDPSREWLNKAAEDAKGRLAAAGVPLVWEDFETVICDFNVMRDGRYYPGRHLAALKEEIEMVTTGADDLWKAWERVVPHDWVDIPPGINKEYLPVYRDTGKIRSHA